MSSGTDLYRANDLPRSAELLPRDALRRFIHGVPRLIRKPAFLVQEARLLLPECMAILGLLGLVWLSTGLLLLREHSNELEVARGMATALSKAFVETTARIVSEVDQTLLSARTSYEQLGPEFDVERWAQTQIRSDQLRVQVAIMDKEGWVVKSTLARSNQGRISIADRPHFKYQLDPSHDELYISDPVIGRGSNEQTIQFSRKLIDRNGNFDGVVVLSLGCAELSRFYDTADTYEGSVTLISERGVIMASGARHAEEIGSVVTAPPRVEQTLNGHPGSWLTPISWDTSNGLVSYQRLGRYPLTVMLAKSTDQVYHRYWITTRHFVTASAIASLIVFVLGLFWILQRRRAVASSCALSVTLANVTQGIVMIDSRGTLSVANHRALRLLRVPEQPGSGSAAKAAIDRLVAAARPLSASVPDLPSPSVAGCQILESVTEDDRVIEIRVTPLAERGTVHTLTDITEQHRDQSRIRYLAHHDILTGLPNRVLLEDEVASALRQAASAGQQVLVMFIDLDDFKRVNDTLGHLLGDGLLRHVAEVIGSTVGPNDFLARLGGDEFIVVRSEVAHPETAGQLAKLLIGRIADPVVIDGHELRVSASIGISVFPRDGLDHHALFKKADIALYCAKKEGRATYRIFEAGMGKRLHRRMLFEKDLRKALESSALQVHFQPQFESGTLQPAGFEALARWNHPKHGWVSPAAFIPVAEESSLIIQLGAFVLERACEEAAQWPSDCFVAVNVSAIQLLDAGFVALVKDIIARTRLPAHRLELELTESVMTDRSRQTASTLASLRELGVSLALDDFGTGYSSLSTLLHFRFDKVKIDSSFVRAQHRDPEARAILEAILAMGRHIGIKVTAEGVETEEQLAMLKRQGCPLVQGYLLGRPAPGWKTFEFLLDRLNSREVHTEPVS